jgi:hypothetical protein
MQASTAGSKDALTAVRRDHAAELATLQREHADEKSRLRAEMDEDLALVQRAVADMEAEAEAAPNLTGLVWPEHPGGWEAAIGARAQLEAENARMALENAGPLS